MARTVALVGVLSLSGLTGLSTVTTADAAGNTALRAYDSTSVQRFNNRILELVNTRRKSHGLRPVRLTSCVDNYAHNYSQKLVRRDLWEHSDLGRLMETCNGSYASENLAAWSPGLRPRAVVRLWMRSPGHRANILSKSARTTGVSIRWDDNRGQWYAVMNFSRPA